MEGGLEITSNVGVPPRLENLLSNFLFMLYILHFMVHEAGGRKMTLQVDGPPGGYNQDGLNEWVNIK